MRVFRQSWTVVHNRCSARPRFLTVSSASRSHTRPHQVPQNVRQRKLLRPAKTFRAETGRRAEDAGLHFLSAPTQADAPVSQRNPQSKKWRSKVKTAATPDILLGMLQEAQKQAQMDASVIGAAVQHCGFQRWWFALLQVHQLHKRYKLDPGIGRHLLLSALARCMKDKTLDVAELAARGPKALELGKQTWKAMPELTSEVAFCAALGSAWSLCDAVGSADAVQWANELHAWSESQSFTATAQTRTPLLLVLEKHRQHDRVNTLLRQMLEKKMIDEVLLSGLIDSAGQGFMCRRVEQLWRRFTNKYKVRPNAICYVAYAKAHLLSGKAVAAVQILRNFDGLDVAGIQEAAPHAAIVFLQALAIVYHSNMNGQTKQELLQYLNEKREFASIQHTVHMKDQWAQLYSTSRRLVSRPHKFLLHDLLHYDNAKRRSKMMHWDNFKAGSKYLQVMSEMEG
ncbi:unnamed protein product [Symbiodinium sp. CCMP2592]|nr:unnamed protein product [Symbiodinium sp. CCMP2592]